MATTEKKYTNKFKEGTLQLVMDPKRTIAEVARELNIPPSTLGGWKRKELQRKAELKQQGEPQKESDNPDKLGESIAEFKVDKQEFDVKSKSLPKKIDIVISKIRDYMLNDTGKTEEGLQTAFNSSVD